MRSVPIILLLMVCSSIVVADNPIIQNLYSADPAPMVHNDTVFLYTSHDEDVTEGGFFTMKNWLCYSTTDMVNWTDHGIVASLQDFSWSNTNGAWAPQCIYRNEKYYLYCPLQMVGIGVLVSDSPYGPFKDPLDKPLIQNSGDDIDPTVFVDDDGQAYLYWGNPKLYYVKLNENMTSYSGGVQTVKFTNDSFGKRTVVDDNRPYSYEEGPWFYKRDNVYYMVFAGGPISEHIGYSTGSGPTGPWTYRGVIMPTQQSKVISRSFTIHPGVIDYKDNSYLFYHNQGLQGGGGFKRSVCVEQFTYKADGSIPAIDMTKDGLDQVGSCNPYDTTEAETICWQSGVETEVCGEGGMNVSQIENSDYIKIKGVDFRDGAISFDARVASNTSGGKIELHLDSENGTTVGTCDVSNTGSWQNWATKSCAVSGATGKHDLYLKFTGGSGTLFNFNWWKFMSAPTGVDINRTVTSSGHNQITMHVVTSGAGMVKVDFPIWLVRENVQVCLFDMTGRLAVKLFDGQLSAPQLSLPLAAGNIRPGSYIASVSVPHGIVLTKGVVVQ